MIIQTTAGQGLFRDIVELAGAFHQTGSIRDHADPNDTTDWNVHGIETCADVYCVDALAADQVIAAVETEAVSAERARLVAAVREMRDGQRRVDELSGTFDWGWAKACERVLDLLEAHR